MNEQTDVFLKDEYLKLQDQYEDYDRRALQIKGWVGAASIAGFAIGSNAAHGVSPKTLLIVSLLSLCFWHLEASWKLFQYAIADRIRIIEAHFRGDPEVLVKDPAPFQIYHWWFRSHVEDQPIFAYEQKLRPRSLLRRYLKAATRAFVHLPYSLIILACAVLNKR